MATPNQQINLALTKLIFFVQKELRAELLKQNHSASGKLYNSISGERVKTPEGARLDIVMEPYGVIVNKGRRPGKFVPIDALIRWVKQRAIATGDKEARSVAWAINYAIMREGTPTRKSPGKTGWIDDTMERIGPQIDEILVQGAELEVINDFDEMIRRLK